jgi:N-acetylglucosaminyl-diphospho-decaprenol L-rhamnosyltransferase
MNETSNIVISIISHKQAHLVLQLLRDIQQFCLHRNPEVTLTINVEEEIPFQEKDFDFRIRIFKNQSPKGFGANHNQAFHLSTSDFFCIANPDVRLVQDPFKLLAPIATNQNIGVIAPLIMNRDQHVEDSARKLPTPFRLIKRVLAPKEENKLDYSLINEPLFPDWLAGIFMVFPGSVFKTMKGFDERYFLYFEDVDLCSRLRLAGYKVVIDPSVKIIHEARRDSHRHLRYLYWHISSGLRFFSSPVFWKAFSRELKIRKH